MNFWTFKNCNGKNLKCITIRNDHCALNTQIAIVISPKDMCTSLLKQDNLRTLAKVQQFVTLLATTLLEPPILQHELYDPPKLWGLKNNTQNYSDWNPLGFRMMLTSKNKLRNKVNVWIWKLLFCSIKIKKNFLESFYFIEYKEL